ncbi:MAG: hypothetical protein HXX08_16965 [Chloroflexi bacterium]|uniref:Uncharacterized protein n=1 Tax=Candidatus Chlorohelix allophototropha TaxID=3003348 RepID=A0A8T7M6F1_9CHLR|nr:hypothetical protein [Chloroflexota bacterium]WJW69463.1 hypothetical protein OZ401_003076 [Chloroflexota bacterium L227-S17]
MSQENPIQTTTKAVKSFNPDKTVKELVEQIRELAGERNAGTFKALGENAKRRFGTKEGSDLKTPLSLLKLKVVDLATIAGVVIYLDSAGVGNKTLNILLAEQGLGRIDGQLNFTRYASQVSIQNREKKLTTVKSTAREVPTVAKPAEPKIQKPVAKSVEPRMQKPPTKSVEPRIQKPPTKSVDAEKPKTPAKHSAGGILSKAVKRFSSAETKDEKAPAEAKTK